MPVSGGHIYVGRQVKIKRLVGSEAVRIAKERKDPLYRRLIRFKRLWVQTRQKIVRKYKSQALQRVRQRLSKGK